MARPDLLKAALRSAIRRRGFDVVRYQVPGEPEVPDLVPVVENEPPAPPAPVLDGDAISIGGTVYSIASDDTYRIGLQQEFEPRTVRLFDCLTSSEHHVLDVGANIGCTTVLFGQRARRVVAFEPSPSTFAFLERNVRSSGLSNVDLRNHGLGAEPGEAELAFAPDNRAGAFVSDKTRGASGLVREKVEIKRLDDVEPSLGLPRVDLLKLDVEGFEKSVIEGAEKTIGEFRPVAVMELNHWCLNALQRTSVPDFLDHLRSVFPILLAVEGETYGDLHDNDESYTVMYRHILHSEFGMIVAAFSSDQLARFSSSYRSISQ